MANHLVSDYQSKKFKIWIHTTICVFILSILTIITFRYIQLYEYIHLGILKTI